jgi:hypothetical protein
LSSARLRYVGAQPRSERGLIELSRSEGKNGLRGIFFGCSETVAIQFEEEHTNKKSGSLVPINERMIADDPCGVSDGQIDHVRRPATSVELAGARKSRFRKGETTETYRTAVERKQTAMQRQRIAFVDPEWFFHFDRECRVLR